MKKYFALALTILLVLSLLVACSAKKEDDSYKIGYSQHFGTVAFCTTMIDGAEDAIAEWGEKGVKAELFVTDSGIEDPSIQIGDLEDLAAQDVDGLCIFPGDSTIVVEPIKNIYNANDIPVVVTDIGIADGEYESFLITDNKAAGALGAEAMAELLPNRGKVVVFQNSPGAINGQNRSQGFQDKAAELGFDVIGEKTLNLSVEEGKALMEDILTSDPDIAGVFTISIETAIGAASALQDAGNTTCKIVAFDINKTAYEMIKEGSPLAAAVIQDPYMMGYEGVNQLLYAITGEDDKIEKEIGVPAMLLTQANADEFADNPQVQ